MARTVLVKYGFKVLIAVSRRRLVDGFHPAADGRSHLWRASGEL
jgi:hypothetical protein